MPYLRRPRRLTQHQRRQITLLTGLLERCVQVIVVVRQDVVASIGGQYSPDRRRRAGRARQFLGFPHWACGAVIGNSPADRGFAQHKPADRQTAVAPRRPQRVPDLSPIGPAVMLVSEGGCRRTWVLRRPGRSR